MTHPDVLRTAAAQEMQGAVVTIMQLGARKETCIHSDKHHNPTLN